MAYVELIVGKLVAFYRTLKLSDLHRAGFRLFGQGRDLGSEHIFGCGVFGLELSLHPLARAPISTWEELTLRSATATDWEEAVFSTTLSAQTT